MHGEVADTHPCARATHMTPSPRTLIEVTRRSVTATDARGVATQRPEDGRWVVRLTGPQGSGILTSMSLANAYAVLPEGQPIIEPGEECDVILVDRETPVPPPAVA